MDDKMFAYAGKTMVAAGIAFVVGAYLGFFLKATLTLAYGAALGACIGAITLAIIEGLQNG